MELMTKEILKALPKLGATSDMEETPIIVKYFTPILSRWYWYVLEGEKQENGDILFFGLVEGLDHGSREYGYFSLSELESIALPFEFKIERDLYFSNSAINKDGLIINLDKRNQIQGILIGDQGLDVVNINTTDGKVSLKEFYRLLDCEVVEHLSLNDELGMWFDEMGLFKNGNFIQSYAFDGEELPQIPGKVLILGVSEEGESIGLTAEQIDYIRNHLSILGRTVIDLGDEDSDPMELAKNFASAYVSDLRTSLSEEFNLSEDEIPF